MIAAGRGWLQSEIGARGPSPVSERGITCGRGSSRVVAARALRCRDETAHVLGGLADGLFWCSADELGARRNRVAASGGSGVRRRAGGLVSALRRVSGFDRADRDEGSDIGNANALIDGSGVARRSLRGPRLCAALPRPSPRRARCPRSCLRRCREAAAELRKLEQIDFALLQLQRLLAHLAKRASCSTNVSSKPNKRPATHDADDRRPAHVLLVGVVGVLQERAVPPGSSRAGARPRSPRRDPSVAVELREDRAERCRLTRSRISVWPFVLYVASPSSFGSSALIESKRASSKPCDPAPATFCRARRTRRSSACPSRGLARTSCRARGCRRSRRPAAARCRIRRAARRRDKSVRPTPTCRRGANRGARRSPTSIRRARSHRTCRRRDNPSSATTRPSRSTTNVASGLYCAGIFLAARRALCARRPGISGGFCLCRSPRRGCLGSVLSSARTISASMRRRESI